VTFVKGLPHSKSIGQSKGMARGRAGMKEGGILRRKGGNRLKNPEGLGQFIRCGLGENQEHKAGRNGGSQSAGKARRTEGRGGDRKVTLYATTIISQK